MNDILIAAASQKELKQVYLCRKDNVSAAGLFIAPEKVQQCQPWQYLGYVLFYCTVRPQIVHVQVPDPLNPLTLNSLYSSRSELLIGNYYKTVNSPI